MTLEVAPYRSLAISRLAHSLEAEGRSILHMEFGQPSTGAPSEAIAVVHAVLDRDPLGYWESPALKQRIARHYMEQYGVSVTPDRIVLTCGASPGLLLAFLANFEAGARIAMARPGYVSYRNACIAAHMQPVEIACGPQQRYQLTAAALATIEPAPDGVVIASPGNPTGTIIPADELQAIAEVCRVRGIRIVSDEIYHGLHYDQPAATILEFEPNAVVVNSYSKYYSMVGWRLGWMVSPPDYAQRARAYSDQLYLTPPSLSQHAALVTMDCVGTLEQHRAMYRHNRQLLLDALPSLGLQEIAPPDGAFYLWASVRHLTTDSMDFCTRLLHDTGVVLAPGVDHDPVDGWHHVRFSFAPHTDVIEAALERLRPWFAAQPRIA